MIVWGSMRIVSIVSVLLLFLGAYFYTIHRIWQMMPPSPIGRTLLILFAVIALVSPFVALALGERIPDSLTGFLYRLGTSWLIIFLYLLIILLVADLIRVTNLLPIAKYMYHSVAGLAGLLVIIVLLIGSGYLVYQNKKRVEFDLSASANGIKAMPTNGLKVVFVSDLHLGYSIGKREFQKWIEIINKESPDIVLIGGDLIDNSARILLKRDFADLFDQLKPKCGVFAVPGNHEYISGIEKSVEFYNKSGITLLRDSSVLINNEIYIIGRDDRSNRTRKSLSDLMQGIDRSKPTILLDHQPLGLDEAQNNGIDLQLSGHTHRGQIWPISLITKLMFENEYGASSKGDTQYYVSSGLGIWGGKFRIGTRSEYVVININ